jgi:hypothetical protein
MDLYRLISARQWWISPNKLRREANDRTQGCRAAHGSLTWLRGANERVRPCQKRLEACGSRTRVAIAERHAQTALGIELRG